MKVRALPYGDHALLLEPDDAESVLGLAGWLGGRSDVEEAVPGARTVLVRADPDALDRVTREIAELSRPPSVGTLAGGETIELDVVYDGADLHNTALQSGLSADEVVRRHAAGDYAVAFCGFAPGFAYLTGLDPALHLPRLEQPRTRIPAGSVAIAAEFTGVYPRASPGGWRLLGRTDAVLWDVERTPPALLPPGTRVRFRPT